MLNIFKKISKYILFFILIILPMFLHAAPGNTPTPPAPIDINIPNPTTNVGNDLMSLLVAILNNIVMPIAAVAVTMYIIYAGFSYLTAQGNPAKVQLAHQRLMWSLVGAGILLGAAGISIVVQNTINALIAP